MKERYPGKIDEREKPEGTREGIALREPPKSEKEEGLPKPKNRKRRPFERIPLGAVLLDEERGRDVCVIGVGPYDISAFDPRTKKKYTYHVNEYKVVRDRGPAAISEFLLSGARRYRVVLRDSLNNNDAEAAPVEP